MDWQPIFELLILLWIANGIPVLVARIFQQRFAWPIDLNHKLQDGFAVFGSSKTWRGLVASLLATSLSTSVLGLDWQTGLLFASLAMSGDLFSSFIKRRKGMPSSSQAFLLDQIPESVLPVVVVGTGMGLSWLSMLLVILLFFISEVLFSKILYRLHIRKRPY